MLVLLSGVRILLFFCRVIFLPFYHLRVLSFYHFNGLRFIFGPFYFQFKSFQSIQICLGYNIILSAVPPPSIKR